MSGGDEVGRQMVVDFARDAAIAAHKVDHMDAYHESKRKLLVRFDAQADRIATLEAENERLEAGLRAAVRYIELSPCDPDVHPDQWEAYQRYEELGPPALSAPRVETERVGTLVVEGSFVGMFDASGEKLLTAHDLPPGTYEIRPLPAPEPNDAE